MANLPEDAGWVEGVRAIEETDPVRFDIYNESLSALASRTKYLQENMGQGGNGGMTGLPFYPIHVAQGSPVPASQFEQEGVYMLSTDEEGQYIKAYVDFSTINPRAFIATPGAVGLFGVVGGEEHFIGNLTSDSYFSTSTGFTGKSAGVPVSTSGDFSVNQNLDIWNWISPGEMFVLSDNVEGYTYYSVQLPSPEFGSVGMEYHFMSELSVPVNFQYEDESPISVAEGLSPTLRAAGSVVTIKKILPDKWIVFGDLANFTEDH